MLQTGPIFKAEKRPSFGGDYVAWGVGCSASANYLHVLGERTAERDPRTVHRCSVLGRLERVPRQGLGSFLLALRSPRGDHASRELLLEGDYEPCFCSSIQIRTRFFSSSTLTMSLRSVLSWAIAAPRSIFSPSPENKASSAVTGRLIRTR